MSTPPEPFQEMTEEFHVQEVELRTISIRLKPEILRAGRKFSSSNDYSIFTIDENGMEHQLRGVVKIEILMLSDKLPSVKVTMHG